MTPLIASTTVMKTLETVKFLHVKHEDENA